MFVSFEVSTIKTRSKLHSKRVKRSENSGKKAPFKLERNVTVWTKKNEPNTQYINAGLFNKVSYAGFDQIIQLNYNLVISVV